MKHTPDPQLLERPIRILGGRLWRERQCDRVRPSVPPSGTPRLWSSGRLGCDPDRPGYWSVKPIASANRSAEPRLVSQRPSCWRTG